VLHQDRPPASTGGTAQVLRTNVGGTALLLAEAARASVERTVMVSSVDVFGCFVGQGSPEYLPLDDAHPTRPQGAYAWAKLAAEELCETFTRATGAASICLRAPGVFDQNTYEFIKRARTEQPASEWSPIWE
jgi:UDP-glucose 4-epimerase